MGFYDAIRVGAAGAADTFQIERSVRISRDSDNYFSVNNSSSGNTQTFTFSFWMKLGKIYSGFLPIYSHYLTGTNRCGITLTSGTGSAGFQYQNRQSNSHKALIDPAEKLRDHSAWYHVVFRMDTTNSTQADRFIIYVNGRRIAFSSGSILVVQNSTSVLNSATTHYIGHDGFSGTGDFYLADIHLIDGQALDASYFAETDATTGQWMPKEYTGSYSGTSYHLKFDDNSGTTATTLGKDSSGLGNNVTPVNFSVAAGEGNDSLTDTPTNNFCTINPLDTYRSGNTLAEGNLKLTRSGSNFGNARGTFAVNTGKWYYEWKCDTIYNQVGWVNTGFDINYNGGDVAVTSSGGNGVGMYWDSRTFMYGWQNSGGNDYFPSSGSYVTYAAGDIIMVAFDVDNFKFWFGKNGSWINVLGTADPASGTDGITPVASKNDGTYRSGMYFTPLLSCFSNGVGHVNFGQRPFSYTIPTGYKTLSSANLPDPTILLPNNHFDTLLWTANGGTQNITGLNFDPDWVWGKSRTSANYHDLYDTVRGDNLRVFSNGTNAEVSGYLQFGVTGGFALSAGGNINDGTDSVVGWNWNAGETDSATYTVKVVSDSGNKYRFNNFGTSAVTLDLAEGGTYTFDGSDSSMSGHPFVIGTAANGSVYSTGVTYQLDGVSVTYSAYTSGYSSASTRKLIITVPASAPVLYYWCSIHSGMGGAVNTNSTLGSSNFDGSLQAKVKANPTAGFSIVSYTGNGSNSTVGHALGVKPDTIIVKGRNIAGQDWVLYNKNLDGGNQPATHIIKLNTTAAEADVNDVWNDTEPTSTVFSVGVEAMVNYNTSTTYVAYVFSEVAGYSKFGSYTGNGNADGTFVFTGFRPAFVIIKRTNASNDWFLQDDKRLGYNPANSYLEANTNLAEQAETDIDILSNGFKCRSTGNGHNASGGTYIYFAFAKSPFKNSRAR